MPERRRVLIVTESLGLGGTESHLVQTLPPLVKQGWQIAVFCLSRQGERAEQVQKQGVRVFAAAPVSQSKRSPLAYPLHLAAAASKLYGLARAWRPDIAHFYLPAPYLLGTPVAMAARVPIKVMSRRSLADYQERWPGAALLERWMHGGMAAIVGNCRAIVKELIDEKVPHNKIRLIYNGIDCSGPAIDRAEARRKLGVEQDALIGAVVANLLPYKGHRDLIEGLASIAAQLPLGWQILCAGDGNKLRAELEALTAARELTANIHFLGLRLDVADLFAAADFGVLPSRANEGFSNAILEAMTAAVPLIVTDMGGNAEAVIDGETGLVVPPAEPRALGTAILRLAQDVELQRRLGEAGRARVRENFSLERCVSAHASLYEELLAEGALRAQEN